MPAHRVQDLGQRHLPAADHDYDHRPFFGDRLRQIEHNRRLGTPRLALCQVTKCVWLGASATRPPTASAGEISGHSTSASGATPITVTGSAIAPAARPIRAVTPASVPPSIKTAPAV